MFAAIVITLREGLEAALIIGIVLGVLQKLGAQQRSRIVWAGVLGAAAISIVMALALHSLGLELEGRDEQLFEGAAMVLAAAVLTWMIFWMQRKGRDIQMELESDVRRTTAEGSAWGLFSLAFVAVVREGIETALFLTAATYTATPVQTMLGGAIGLLLAAALGWVIFMAGKRLNVQIFFRATSVLLIFFAAGLVAHGVHEFQEAAVLPALVEHVWDTNRILNEGSVGGELLATLFGYNANPSLLEVIAYVVYFAAVGIAAIRFSRPQAAAYSLRTPAISSK